MLPPSQDHRPLTAAQHGIWVGQQLDLKSPVYNAGECIELRGAVDPVRFESALRKAVADADALHSRFVAGAEGPVQRIDAGTDWTLQHVDLSGEADPWAAAREWMWRDLGRTVDLGTGPLFAQALLTVGPERSFWFQRIHHIAMDGYGFSLLARRVAELYTAEVTGKAAPAGFNRLGPVLEEDVAYWSGAQFEKDRDFWVKRFEDAPVPPLLAEAAPMSSRFLRRSEHLRPELMAALQAGAKQAGVSWSDLVLAVTAIYLHQRTGAPEAVLGLPVMGRLGSASLRVPCMAMNIVPLRVSVRPDAGLYALARDVAAEMKAARPHLRYRYEQLRRDLRLVGGQRKLFGPVVNIMPFDYALDFAGVPGTAHNISAGPVEDLSFGFHARSGGTALRVDLDANPSCYTEAALKEHQRGFLQLLESLLAQPEQPVRRSATGEVGSVLDGGPVPPVRPVLELLKAQAEVRPDAVALEHGRWRMTYRELVTASQALASRLVEAGVRPDTAVAVKVPRGIDAIVSSLGILFAGAGYLPIDPTGPATRNAAILQDARPAVMVVSERPLPDTDPTAPGGLVVQRLDQAATSAPDSTEPASAAAPAAQRPGARDAEAASSAEVRLAYVIYTSGSTGQPNGVQISHGALAHFVASATQRYRVGPEDRVLQFAPLHFDASVEEIFVTLCAGGRLVLRTDEMLQSVPRLMEACAEAGITLLDLPTAFWHELAYSLSTGAARLPDALRTVIIGGEAALPERIVRWKDVADDRVRLLNTYGPTEATVVATVAEIAGPDALPSSDEVPIGRPLPGVIAAVVTPQGRLAAPGKEGELCLMGGALARGYLGRPELDAARFTRLDAVEGTPRAYRTGDKVRVREDGQLVFVGRVDDEFKISGHRIDPAEVETVLLKYPGIREAAVVGQVLPGGSRRLCAHLVASPEPSPAELRKHLLAALPAPMVPGAFAFAERLPRTSTGKIDRKALQNATPADESAALLASATPMERTVLEVWEQVLGRAATSLQDDFFELGGQSLQSIQVANRLGIAVGRDVPVATVFKHPTVSGLAQALQGGSTGGAEAGGLTAAMLADAELGEDIVPSTTGEAWAREPSRQDYRQVLLTGATGFVGAHLLHQLLTRTDARIICPVRAKDEAQAMERLRSALTGQKLPLNGLEARVLALPADLSQPLLGLDATRFHGLAAECDAVIHNAAVVSVVREYGSLQGVNVRGTRELLKLAAAVRPKPFHYVSTLAVAPQANLSPDVPEAFVPAHPGLRDGYQQSKWIAERLVQQASERGLPATVYRLGRVVGAPDTALVNTQDLVWRIVLAGLPVRALPLLDVGEVWTPVDFVASAIVQLSRASHPGAVFNVTPAAEVRLSELFGWVRDYGYPLDLCHVPEWRDRVAKGSGGHDATLAFFDLRSGDSTPAFGLGPIRCERLLAALEGTGVRCPPTDRTLLYRYLDSCVAQGILPPKVTALP
ncbi:MULTISPECIES: myxochelin non-ribosomal peptide synthetase MxcG [unclassified Corallococcus]|uniref:myxochelin non-ribosomal peptide synthetase MxcG n=1 Tax=unclassified Corallococcus TaxID=2685029 RepID=UPI001A8DCEEB|nr:MULTISPECIES: myxochelin non-ribosomal peptide synthetase MxcG [unclassified Corallococcus]MBN9685533.1 myxochelin non-ribosomal peptide synthetase MxcG [Corallococcus sp. NCSPR001]WAS83019.1 myxochelin non-ribosomal peptide synthetase MxcG [Corallococcus sp. NCRR]